MDEDFIKSPKVWHTKGISRFMFFMGPVSSIFDYITFALMYFLFSACTPASQSLFQTGWFVEGLLSQVLVIHIIRTGKIPFIQSRAAAPVIFMTLVIAAIGLIIPYTQVGAALKMTPLPIMYYPYLAGILLSYGILTQVVKRYFIRKYGQWL